MAKGVSKGALRGIRVLWMVANPESSTVLGSSCLLTRCGRSVWGSPGSLLSPSISPPDVPASSLHTIVGPDVIPPSTSFSDADDSLSMVPLSECTEASNLASGTAPTFERSATSSAHNAGAFDAISLSGIVRPGGRASALLSAPLDNWLEVGAIASGFGRPKFSHLLDAAEPDAFALMLPAAALVAIFYPDFLFKYTSPSSFETFSHSPGKC